MVQHTVYCAVWLPGSIQEDCDCPSGALQASLRAQGMPEATIAAVLEGWAAPESKDRRLT